MQYTFETHPDFPLARPETRKEVFVLLDKYFPGITDEIKIDSLNMFDQSKCVIGQTIGWRNRVSMFKSEGESPQVDWNFATDNDAWKEALMQYRREKAEAKAKVVTDEPRFKVGDRVLVNMSGLHLTAPKHRGAWVDGMDAYVGNVYTVASVDKDIGRGHGYRFEEDGGKFLFDDRILTLAGSPLKEIDAKIAAAKAELDKLLKEKQELEALDQEVTIKLTRREVQDLLNRKVGNVKQKILKQIA